MPPGLQLLAASSVLAIAACGAHTGDIPCHGDENCPSGMSCGPARRCVPGDATIFGPLPRIPEADVLFLVDNSPNMEPAQAALARALPGFLDELDRKGVDSHIGFVTSDCGAQPAEGMLSGPLGGSCDSATGDDGTLQFLPCTARPPSDFSGPSVQALCSTLCPTPAKPIETMVGGSMATIAFVASSGGASPATNVVATGLSPEAAAGAALSCMAFVGDRGCGIEMQLEAVERALDGTTNPVANRYFLRPGAFLAVVMVTNEDDCSVENRLDDDPSTMDCSPGGSFTPNWQCFNPDYRCFAEGTRCDQPLDQPGLKTGCVATTGSYLYDVSHYTDFLDALRPGRVAVYGFVSPRPPETVEIDENEGPGTPGLNRSQTNPACPGPVDPVTGNTFVGDPQVRLQQVIDHYGTIQYPVCDLSYYPKALIQIADAIAARS